MPSPPVEGGSAEVVVSAPDGSELASVTLSGTKVTVGRLPDVNDIALHPDPELLVTRAGHFAFEREGSQWFVVDGGSVNGTFLRRGGTLQPVTASADLARVVKVTVQLQVDPARAGAVQAGQSSTFQDDATFRVPTDLSTATTTYQGPKCTT